MATYKEIQDWVKINHGFTAKTCWIAHVKEITGLEVRRAPNRQSRNRKMPCPPDKVESIRQAFRHFRMM